MGGIEKQYISLLNEILDDGVVKSDRTGTGTLSLFGRQIRHDMSEGFPLLTTKRMAVKTMMTELKWFLKGGTNIKYLVDNKCHIWNGDCYKSFKSTFSPMPGIQSSLPSQEEFIDKIKNDDEFAQKWGELGPIYGNQWRAWGSQTQYNHITKETKLIRRGIDQIRELITNIKENPDSRRLMVSAWNVSEIDNVVLPPCHYGFQCYVNDGKLSLMWNQRSVDAFLGLPFNIASYGMLLTLLAEEVGMVPGELIGNLGDTHLYSNHVEQADEQIGRTSFDLPRIKVSNVDILNGEFDYEIQGYEYHPSIKAPLSN